MAEEVFLNNIYPFFTHQLLQKIRTHWFFPNFSVLLCFFVLASIFAFPNSVKAHTTVAIAYTISGAVYDDYNENGTQDNREPGINGITVTAYNSANMVVTTDTTKSIGLMLGQYTLSIASGVGATRIEFTNFGASSTLPALTGYQSSSHLGGTSVAFIAGTNSSNDLSLGLEHPAEYCQNNPNLATSCYVRGDQTQTTDHVVVRFPYTNSGNNTNPTPIATAPEVGATWGLTYRRSSDTLFLASYFKRHSGLKPGGSTGAIYSISGADSATPAVNSSPFVDLNALFGSNTAGANTHDSTNNYLTDGTAYSNIGKVSLGGLAISEDESVLYVINLYDKQLYRIPIGSAPNAPTPPTAADVVHSAVPVPSDCTPSDFRPFASTVYRGQVYVGAVCSAESTITNSLPAGDATKLKAYVFSYTDSSGFVTNPVLEFPLNYTRHCANSASSSTCLSSDPAAWNPWTSAFTATSSYTTYPQPILSSIAFDNGNMVLGIRDRFGDQMGVNAPAPTGGSSLYNGITAGDTLRACLQTAGNITSGWTLESNATCGGNPTRGKDTGFGPGTGTYNAASGNGLYYYQQRFLPYHDYTALGGVLQVPGLPGVVTTAFDPTTNIDSGGVRTYDNSSGAMTNSYQIYQEGTPNTFSKSNGLGSLVAFCHAAPIEIGNRVWLDTNGNGIQDPGESVIANVTVHLYAANGTTLLQTTTTNTSGNYYFSISPYTSYVVKLDNAADYASNGPLAGYQLTSAYQDTNAAIADSKGILPQANSGVGSGNYPQAVVQAHNPGENDYTFDFGFTAPPDLLLAITNTGGNTFEVGDSVTYQLQVSNSSTTGPVVATHAITVTDPIPAGLQQVNATGTGWSFTVSSTTSPSTVTATYTGAYPVAPSAVLPIITITGTLTSAGIGNLTNTATVNTVGDSSSSNNSGADGIVINAAPTPTPIITPTLGVTPGITPTPTLGVTPTSTPGITPTPTLGVTPTSTPGITPTPTLRVTPTSTPRITPTPAATPRPVPTSTPIPTVPTDPTGDPGLPPTGNWS